MGDDDAARRHLIQKGTVLTHQRFLPLGHRGQKIRARGDEFAKIAVHRDFLV